MKFYLLATLFVSFCAKSEEKQVQCPASNVAFVMDLSKTTTNYHSLEKDVVQRIVDRFPENSRFSLVTFGTKATRRAAFESDKTAAAFKSIVANLKGTEEGPQSHLDEAIQALPERFPIENGQREKNYLFVLTDGFWTKAKKNPGNEIRVKMSGVVPQGVRVTVFGIGSRPKMSVLRGFFPIGKAGKSIHLLRRSSLGERAIKAIVKKAMDQACKPPGKPDCMKKLDLGFIIDRSGSINCNRPGTFENLVLGFVVNAAKAFNISRDGVHAGVVVFGTHTDTKVEIPLGQHTDTDSFVSVVKDIKYPKLEQYTYINKALNVTNNELFKSSPRDGVKRYAILLTDGNQTVKAKDKSDYDEYWDTTPPEKEAEGLWKKKIDILAFGVGSGFDKASLERITNNERNGRVREVKTFKDLENSIQFVTSFVCSVCKMNLVVVLDASGSTKSRYNAEKYVLLEMARLVNVKRGGSQVSVISFSEEGSLDLTFPPDGQQAYNEFIAALPKLQSHGSNKQTKIESGLELVNEAMSYSSNKGRKAVVVITDALQTAGDIEEVKIQAAAIRKKGYPIKTISLQSKRSLSSVRKLEHKPLDTLKYISGSDDGNFFIRYPPRGIHDPAFVKDVVKTVNNVLRSICGQ